MKNSKHDYLWLPDGSLVKYYNLNKPEFEKLAGSNKAIFNASLSSNTMKVYSLQDEYVIYSVNNKFFFKFLLNDFIRAHPTIMSSGIYSEFRGINIYGKDFPLHTGSLVKELCSTLQISTEPIDRRTLHTIDEALNKLDEDARYLFRHKYYLHLTAIVGEVFIRDFGNRARWEMEPEEDAVTWIPFIGLEGHEISFTQYLYEDLFEHPERQPFPLKEAYETLIDIAAVNLNIRK